MLGIIWNIILGLLGIIAIMFLVGIAILIVQGFLEVVFDKEDENDSN